VWFILEIYIAQLLISTTSIFECISRLIKVTENKLFDHIFPHPFFFFFKRNSVQNLCSFATHCLKTMLRLVLNLFVEDRQWSGLYYCLGLSLNITRKTVFLLLSYTNRRFMICAFEILS
jgi:hypothetical protein